ncbi:AraC family transcriptional regulator [Shimia isoporae]|uniref:AraC family transcriptional regulator n=1 Tax=Shimia isoporae TaxID=647720 RepID=A0A4R1NKX4_9RHOB|nr:AraC family transcriptional regulator [Shimia isoporae]TCL08745.1 AraC family transcriptional regulator [Shimia isoporae]
MSKDQIKSIIERVVRDEGLFETGVSGVQLFRVATPMPCVPAVYEPSVVAIVSGAKEAVLDGERHVYDSERYMCCSMSMPAEAGTPEASPEAPLLGVSISLDTRVMTELAIEMENAGGGLRTPKGGAVPQGVALAHWDAEFSDALLRLVQLVEQPDDAAVLGAGRLRELYYAVLKGEAGDGARRAFGVGNEIARTIEFLSTRLDETVTIDDLASEVGMSRAVFHRKFKQATTMSPIQFVKSMRLNSAAMKIAAGTSVTEAAMDVGYASSSQFSREFKRAYGQSPKRWGQNAVVPAGVA